MLENYAEDVSLMDGEASEDVREYQLPGLIELTQMVNIVDLLPEDKRAELAKHIQEGYDVDENSREDWLKRAEKGVKLAAQHAEEKTYPWAGAANAMHPVITQAAMQFNARALPAIMPDGDVVKTVVHGMDPGQRKQKRANRVSKFMSYQLRTKVRGWAQDTDSLLARLPIEGHLFRKLSYDPARNQTIAKLYSAAQVIVNEGAESLERAPRISELLELSPVDIIERIRIGVFADFDEWENATPANEDGADDWQQDDDAPQTFIQQYTRYDLDGDGYPEPYVCVVHKPSGKLVRVIANFTEESIKHDGQQVLAIEPDIYFVDYRFFPSLDGGYHGVGLAHLLGNNIELVNAIINQLLDSGHLSSLGAGFIGRGINTGKGSIRLRPAEWRTINASGDDIRKAMVQLDFPGPSPVLFQLLGVLIETAKDVASVSNVMTGEQAPANQPAATTLALIEQGMQVFNAAFSRIYGSLVREYEILARINSHFLDPEEYARFHDLRADPKEAQAAQMGGAQMPPQGMPQQPGMQPEMQPMPQGMPPQMMQPQQEQIDPAQDFDLSDMDIEPAANPRAVTSIQELVKAQMLMELAQTGAVNPGVAIKRVLRSAGFDDVDELMPEPDPQAQQMQAGKMQALEQLQMRGMQAEVQKTEAEAIEKAASAKQKEAAALKTVADAEAAEEGQDIDRYRRDVDDRFKEQELALRKLELIERFEDNRDRRRTERLAKLPNNQGGSGGA
jgi:chaperonin GroES